LFLGGTILAPQDRGCRLLVEGVGEGAGDLDAGGVGRGEAAEALKDKRRSDGVIERLAAHLAEVSLVTFGAYGQAASVVGVREESATPNLDAVQDLLRDIRR